MMESSAADQMADTSDSFDSLSSLVSHVSDHDSTSPNVQPLDGTSPADEGNEMEEAGGPDSGIGSSFVDNHGPSQTAAAGDSQASGAAGNTATIPDDPFSKFAQDIRASVPDGDNVVSEPVPEQSRFAITVKNLDGDDEMEAAGGDSDMGSSIGPFPLDVDNRGPSQIGAAGDSQASEAAGNTTTTADNVAQNTPDSVHEVTMGSEPVDGRQQLGSGVKYGGPDDVASCAERIHEIKDRSDVQGQDGVLVDNEILRIADNRYHENSEYDRVKLLGEGSFGTVKLIEDRQSKVKAVEKCIPLKRFCLNEAINWCRLNHPSIVRFLGLILTDVTVRYFSGYNVGYQTIEQRKIQRGSWRIETQQALSLIEQLFQALDYIHSRDIVHGDIHGGNILINESADRISLKMIDFGDSEKIDGHNYRRDVRCAIEILKRLCGARLSYDNQVN
ncbi:cAMP-dependent protein kinase catalytic subunit 3-like [Patiria miniata]|uniref:Protein kinase domain-containing protein n=1 Tax=Patiria miniata TaxID=46514 RepID=A0A913ZE24_PATMI|nr:cAMP-dependent protein kinase catalytic subunit 3-like [Patiria miniata]